MPDDEMVICAGCDEEMKPIVGERSKKGLAIKCPLCGESDWIPKP